MQNPPDCSTNRAAAAFRLACGVCHTIVLCLQITVDGDTSTNDAVLGLASGAAGGKTIKHSNSEEAQQLEAAVTALLQVQKSLPACPLTTDAMWMA